MPTKESLATWLKTQLGENRFENDYAVLSHYLSLQGTPSADFYANILRENNFDLSGLPSKNEYQKKFSHYNPKRNPSFTFIDLFAGIGGFRLAMQANGGECVFTSEWDEAAQKTYSDNYGEIPFGDITKPEIKAMIPAKFDVLCAGFPCQPFSNIGLRKGIEDTRGTLFYHIAEILQSHPETKAVFLENVRGLISNDGGNTLRTILQTITKMGYACNIPQEIIDEGSLKQLKDAASKLVLNPKDFGVPQNRPRIYIVLWKKNLNLQEFKYPNPTNEETCVGSIIEENVPDSFTISDKLWAGFKRRKERNELKGNGFTYNIFNSKSKYTNALIRRYYKDGHEILISQARKNPRKLTPREAANLQGFPKTFKLPLSSSAAYQQFGNSVTVPLIEKIGKQIVNQILKG